MADLKPATMETLREIDLLIDSIVKNGKDGSSQLGRLLSRVENSKLVGMILQRFSSSMFDVANEAKIVYSKVKRDEKKAES